MRFLAVITLLLLAFEAGRLTKPFPRIVEAQDQRTNFPIVVDNVNLSLGMPGSQALAKFGPGYRLDPWGENGRMVMKLSAGASTNYEPIATLAFNGGRLSRVIKMWVLDQQSIESFWNGLYGSITGAVGTRGSRAMVVARESTEPNMNNRQIVLIFEGRSIQITRGEEYGGSKTKGFTVNEIFPPFDQRN
jgi:hypothetical protein